MRVISSVKDILATMTIYSQIGIKSSEMFLVDKSTLSGAVALSKCTKHPYEIHILNIEDNNVLSNIVINVDNVTDTEVASKSAT